MKLFKYVILIKTEMAEWLALLLDSKFNRSPFCDESACLSVSVSKC